MTRKEKKITVTEFSNGHLLLDVAYGVYYVRAGSDIMRYTLNDMIEIYNYSEIH